MNNLSVQKLRRWAGRALLLLGGLAIALLAVEAVLRVFNPLHMRLQGDRILLPRNERRILKNTVSNRLPPEIVYSRNSLGLRGPEPPGNFASALTVIAVGGSTTESRYQSDEKTWPDLAAGILAPHFRDLWVNNAGLDGHSTYGHILLLDQYLLSLHPSVLVFLVGVNDVRRQGPKAMDAPAPDEEPGWLTRLARVSAVAATIQNIRRVQEARRARLVVNRELDVRRLPHVNYAGLQPERLLKEHSERFLPGYRDRLTLIVMRCRNAGILPVLVTQPALYGPGTDDRTGVDLGTIVVEGRETVNGALAWEILELYNSVTREVGRTQGVPVIDLARALPKSSRLFYDFHHYTDEGAAAVAGIVARELCPILSGERPQYLVRACSSAP